MFFMFLFVNFCLLFFRNIENELRREILSNHENEGINIITLPGEGLDSHGSNQFMEEIEGFFENFFSFGIKPDQFFKSFPSKQVF